MAEAAGILGLRAETADQVRPMIEQALSHDGPALIEAIVSRQELSMPPTITVDQIKGFSLFMIKAVLDGRGSEIIDLAKRPRGHHLHFPRPFRPHPRHPQPRQTLRAGGVAIFETCAGWSRKASRTPAP
jgi:hypothetical protein